MRRGEVVEIDWPYSDLTGSKKRPAIVVQADYLNGLIDDTILVQVTSVRHGLPGTEVLLDPAVETASGLRKVCVASCTNILTIDQDRLMKTIGYISDAALQQISDCLKTVLDLP
jgi:mRNA interferase MazF